MKKILVLGLFLLSMGSMRLAAQNTVSGTITDKQGEPLPGAKVVVKGRDISTLTELDGTFKLDSEKPVRKIIVYYGGMRPRTINVEPLKVELSKVTWWNRKPDKYRWFASLQAGFPEADMSFPSFGLMLGGMKNFGWYVKGLYRPFKSTDEVIWDKEKNDFWTTGKSKNSFYSATGGFILRLWCPIHLYAGAGYAKRKVTWELYDGSCVEYAPESYDGAVLDFGLMFRVNRFFVSGGSIYVIQKDGKGNDFVGNVGIGYCF